MNDFPTVELLRLVELIDGLLRLFTTGALAIILGELAVPLGSVIGMGQAETGDHP